MVRSSRQHTQLSPVLPLMKTLRASLALTILLVAGCDGDDPTGPETPNGDPLDLSQPWVTSTPAEEGIDPGGLTVAVDSAGSLEFVRSLLVIRNGRLVQEEYFGSSSQSTVFDVHSVTKTVTALVVGIAVDDGALDVDDPMVDWLPPDDIRPEHDGITVDHLLTMTSGIQWSDEVNFGPWIRSGRPVGYVLDQPVVAPPGQEFIYATGGSHLLSAIVGEAIGGSTLDFAEERLLEPLGITEGYWISIGGQPLGGVGLGMRARDMARLGQLVLQGGRSGDRQLVSQQWIDQAFGERVDLPVSDGFGAGQGYGYQVWTEGGVPESVAMIGFGGQFVWIVPELDLVVAATSQWSTSGFENSGGQTAAVIRIIQDLIIPAVDAS